MMGYLGNAVTWLGVAMARPGAFLIVALYVVLWLLISPKTLDWHAAATLATWLMTLFIQRAEHRDTQAIHAKLDNLLEKIDAADTGLKKIDRQEPEEIEAYREKTTA